jgi:hypothetical protein
MASSPFHHCSPQTNQRNPVSHANGASSYGHPTIFSGIRYFRGRNDSTTRAVSAFLGPVSKLFRWSLLAALAVLALPIFQEFLVELAQRHHLFENPGDRALSLLGYVQRIAHIRYFKDLLMFVAGLTLGVWTDALLKSSVAGGHMASLGQRAIDLGNKIIVTIETNTDLDTFHQQFLFADIRGLSVELGKLGLTHPSENWNAVPRAILEKYHVYFSHIGPLLRDGYKMTAVTVSKEIVEHFDSSEAPSTDVERVLGGYPWASS